MFISLNCSIKCVGSNPPGRMLAHYILSPQQFRYSFSRDSSHVNTDRASLLKTQHIDPIGIELPAS